MKFLNIFWDGSQRRLRLVPRLLLYVLFYLLSFLGFSVLVNLTGAFSLTSSLVASGIIEAGLTLLVVWSTGKLLDRRPFTDFGFHFNRGWLKDLCFGLALGAALMTAIFLFEWVMGWVSIVEFFGTNTMFSFIPTRAFFWSQFLQALIFYFLAAFSEELFFRAYPFINLLEGFQKIKIKREWAAWLAAVLTSAVFGLAHVGNPHATWISTLYIFLAGIMLSIGFIYSGQAALSIGLHFTWNFFQGVIFGFPISGTVSPANLIRIEQHGAELLTGGSFGPEAGLVGVIAMLLGILLIYIYLKRR
jgi:membrane protease YdiL (CAAX protease family)